MHLNAKFTSESELKAKLDFIFSRSKKGASFNGIWEVAFNEVTITTAIHNIKSNDGSHTPGIDGWGIDRILQMDREEVYRRVIRKASNYYPKPVRRVYIEKDNGKLRPLGIPTIWDRIIQECLRIVLEPIAEAKFYPHSYGFRPYRSTNDAITITLNTINGPAVKRYFHIIEGDIKSYFDNVNHRLLIKKLWKIGVKDKRVLSMISKMLKAGYIEDNQQYDTKTGTPQGGILSPLLANIYLNDFDWTVGRLYAQPFTKYEEPTKKQLDSKREYLTTIGTHRRFLVRYADDWIILTISNQEARRLLNWLKKYFKHRLKLELSDDKTVITDLSENPIKFLGNVIRLAPARRSEDNRPLAKPYPDMKKVMKQWRELREMVKQLRDGKDSDRVIQIERINDKIVGISQSWSNTICSKIFRKFDHWMYLAIRGTFRRVYGSRNLTEHRIKAKQLNNRPQRHANYNAKVWAVKYKNLWIGITSFAFTHSQHQKYAFDQKMTPYTMKGREIYQKRRSKRLPLSRPPLYDPETLLHSMFRKTNKMKKYDFEYYMNREYAYNRDKGNCKVCSEPLVAGNRNCHHVDNTLPLNQINKVSNLAWLCIRCHNHITIGTIPEDFNKKMKAKMQKYIDQIHDQKQVSV